MLLLSLALIVQVETLTSDRTKKQLIANEHARFAALMALGELQRTAGSDQAITARADILDNTADAPISTNDNDIWTGVWDTTNPSADPTWLISGHAASSATNPPVPDEAIDSAQGTINLMTYDLRTNDADVTNTSNYELDKELTAGLELATDPTGKPTGTFGWVVLDEGVKARIDKARETHNTATTTTALLENAPQSLLGLRSGFELVDGFGGITETDPRLDRVIEPTHLTYIDPSLTEDTVNLFGQDFSLHSQGIQTNTVDGGLKADLSYGFRNPNSFLNVINRQSWLDGDLISRCLIQPADAIPSSGMPNPSSGAPNWGILYDYYNLYDANYIPNLGKYNSGSQHQNRSRWDNYNSRIMSYFRANNFNRGPWINPYRNGDHNYQEQMQISALMARAEMNIAVEWYDIDPASVAPTPDWHAPRIQIQPMFGIYNPYNVTIRAETLYFYWELTPTIVFNIGGNVTEVALADLVSTSIAGGGFRQKHFRWRIDGGFELEPGQTVMFMPQVANVDYNTLLSNTNAFATGIDNVQNNNGYYVLDTQNVDSMTGNSQNMLTVAEQDDLRADMAVNPIITLTCRMGDHGDGAEYQRMTIAFNQPDWEGTNNYRGESQTIAGIGGTDGGANSRVQTAIPGTMANFNSLTLPTDALFNWSNWLRTTTEPDDQEPLRNLVDSNIRFITGYDQWDGFASSSSTYPLTGSTAATLYAGNIGYSTISPFTGGFDKGVKNVSTGILNIETYAPANFHTYWGASLGAASGSPYVPLWEIPHRVPPLSMGALRHANLGRFSQQPSTIIGNSYAPMRIDSSRTWQTGFGPRNDYIYDSSYHVNKAMWDGYFMSSVLPTIQVLSQSENNVKDGTATLLNSRYLYSENPRLPAIDLDAGNSNSTFELTASRIYSQGQFNINSTSVVAWKAFLAGMSNAAIPRYNNTTGALTGWEQAATDKAPFPNALANFGGDGDIWLGFRSLNETELETLAIEIVDEIKNRVADGNMGHPFLGLAEFINRQPEASNSTYRKAGTIQAAIDRASINNGFPDNTIVRTPPGGDFSGANMTNNGDQGALYPTSLDQGDILQALAPFMSTRSDTFTIRGYGTSFNALSQQTDAQAYCEIVVQRTTEPVDDELVGNTAALLNPDAAGGTFGRQMKIISMRWIHPSEI